MPIRWVVGSCPDSHSSVSAPAASSSVSPEGWASSQLAMSWPGSARLRATRPSK
ncbi:hypothetical protein [Nocardiopsis akebiae]|uniref:hypothetical protein n=1 Tax=Nocardiopsis akebiae TaxID=2831968 RepID=UPI0020160FF0|nr:hypothetical protein [Nocardiopsis akebiae]